MTPRRESHDEWEARVAREARETREAVEQLRALPLREAYPLAKRLDPAAWRSLVGAPCAMVVLWLLHGWMLYSFGNLPSLLGLVLLPIGMVLMVRGLVYARVLVTTLGFAVGVVGFLSPFWIMNAT